MENIERDKMVRIRKLKRKFTSLMGRGQLTVYTIRYRGETLHYTSKSAAQDALRIIKKHRKTL